MPQAAPEQDHASVQPFVVLGRALAFGLFPAALLPPVALPWSESDTLYPICLYVLLTLAPGMACGSNRNGRSWFFGWPVWLFLAALLTLQALAMHASVMHWELRQVDAVGTYGGLLKEVAMLLWYALGVKLLCNVPGAVVWLARGAVFSLLLLLGVCCLQLAWLLTGPEFLAWLGQGIILPALPGSAGRAVAALNEYLAPILSTIGSWLEARCPLHPDPVYENGAYTLTVLRINGVFSTASDLAVILATAYAPLILAGLATAGAWGRRLYILLAAAMIVALIGGRCLTAFAACLFLLAWLGRRILWAPGRRVRALLLMLLVAGLSVGALYHDPASRRLAARVCEPGAVPLPEETVAREIWTLVQERPWTGVGYGWSSIYVVHGRQYAAILQAEEIQELLTWQEDVRTVPTPSLGLEFLAVFGIPLALAVAVSFFWLWLRLRRLARQNEADPERRFALAAAVPYLSAVAVFVQGDVDWTHPLLLLPCFSLWAVAGVWERAARGSAPGPAADASKGTRPASGGKKFAVPSVTKKGETRISDSASRPFTLSGGG